MSSDSDKNLKRPGKEENAVTPVIGVILMVLITIVLSASVAVFANYIANKDKVNIVAVEVTRINDTHIKVKYLGSIEGHDLLYDAPGTLSGNYGRTPAGFYGTFNVSVNGAEVTNLVPEGTHNCTSTVGSIQYFSPVPKGSHVSVIANFKGNTRAVIWQGNV